MARIWPSTRLSPSAILVAIWGSAGACSFRAPELPLGQHAQGGQLLGGGVVQLLADPLLFQGGHLQHFPLQGLAGAQVAQDAGEPALAPIFKLADRQVHRKDRAVLAAALDFPADADDVLLPRLLIARQVAVVLRRGRETASAS